MKFKFSKTERGFFLIEFEDQYHQKCSLQKSSLGECEAVWLGVDNTGPLIMGPSGKYEDPVSIRMHLTKKQVSALLPLLKHFVITGDLPKSAKDVQ